MRRSFALLLCVTVLMCAFCLTAFADEMDGAVYYDTQDTAVFSDVSPENWFYDDVMALTETGVIGGFPDGSFRPSGTVTTGQALKMLLLVVGYDEPAAVESHWARGYMNLALEEGILIRGEITDLDVAISRQLVATLAARAMGVSRASESYTFADAPNDDVQALVDCGIIGGYNDGTFRPNKSLTRAELSAIVHRIQNYLGPTIDIDLDGSDEIETKTTEQGIAFIKSREGFSAKAYWDYAQYSIGYGSRCEKNEYPDGITEQQADRLLRARLLQFEEKVSAFCEENDLSLSDSQYDALVSLSYNVGVSWMSSSRLAQLIRSGSYTTNELASAIGIWCHVTQSGKTEISQGLITRRMLELKLFLYGDYEGTSSNDFCYLIYETDRGTLDVDVAMYELGSTYDPLFSVSSRGDTFAGWFTESGDEITEDTRVRESMSVYARWEGDSFDDSGASDDDETFGEYWSDLEQWT